VASRTLDTATWNATILKGDVAAAVRALKQDDGGDLLIAGSGQLIDFLTGHHLIDEYRLMIHPIILGTGTKRLFATAPRRTLSLVDSVSFPQMLDTTLAFIDTVIPGQRFVPAGLSYQHRRKAR
jgi:dihydrofolate reductase